MKRVFGNLLSVGILFCAVAFTGARPGQASQPVLRTTSQAGVSSLAFQPDRDFVQAAARKDAKAVGKHLDADLIWTDARGRSLTRAQVLEKLPQPALGDESQALQHEWMRGPVKIVRAERDKTYVLRVWVKRPAGWRVLLYQEVIQVGPLPQTASATSECENPCKTVPFSPKTQDERLVIQSYQQVERAVVASDSITWGSLIDNGFFAVTSISDRPQDKPGRMAGLAQNKQAGIAAFPLVSAHMSQFGGTMIMTSRQQPDHGKPLHVTRIWIKPQGKWLEIFSYQTSIQDETL